MVLFEIIEEILWDQACFWAVHDAEETAVVGGDGTESREGTPEMAAMYDTSQHSQLNILKSLN